MNQLFQPITLKQMTLKNRIVFAPTTLGREAFEILENLAKGGVGLIVLADISVVPSIMGAPSLGTDMYFDYFRKILDLCHQHNTMVSAQLFHPEYDPDYITSLYKMKDSMSREDIRKELARSTDTFCDELTEEKIHKILDCYETAARNAVLAGFDMIQIHGDRLAGSFSSSIFNHRSDAFGEYRYFAGCMVKRIRAAAPDMPLDYKLTVRTETPALGRGGVLFGELPEFISLLDELGIDSYHVSIANHTSIRDTIPEQNHPDLPGEGCFSHLALEVKKYTDKPVCAVGKIQHPAFAEDLLDKGIDMVAMSRQLIADPYWPEKVRTGHEEDIISCIFCNKKCVQSLLTGQPIGCILHKEVSNEG